MTKNGRLLILDMDGVLVDVRESYREAVIECVRALTGAEITHEEIQRLKNRGNSNNDWDLTLELACERGCGASREEVIRVFQKIYLGENCQGLISRERWLPQEGALERLAARFRLALFTGRERWEAAYTLSKFAPRIEFDPIVGMEDVQREKPDPEGLLHIVQAVAPAEVYYVGDVMDDCRAARAAGIPFVGVIGSGALLREAVGEMFRKQGACAVIRDINELEQALP